MIRKNYAVFFLIFNISICFGQKPALTFSDIENWPRTGGSSISNDGRYIVYDIEINSSNTQKCIHAIDGTFEKVVPDIPNHIGVQFSNDSRNVFYWKQNDSLCILNLDSKIEKYISNCNSFAMPNNGNSEWIAYSLNNLDLIILNLVTGETKKYSDVKNYRFSNKGQVLLINQTSSSTSSVDELNWLDLVSGKSIKIWSGEQNTSGFTFRNDDDGAAFFVLGKKRERVYNAIWYYRRNMDSAMFLVGNYPFETDTKLVLQTSSPLKFSPDDERLFFEFYKIPDTPKLAAKSTNPTIWNYKDLQTQAEQQIWIEAFNNLTYLAAVVNLDTKNVLRLEEDYEGSALPPKLSFKADYLLTQNRFDESSQSHDAMKCAIRLKSIKDSFQTCISKDKSLIISGINFSPGGKFIYWYDKDIKQFRTYDIQRKKYITISKNVPFPIFREEWDVPASPAPYGLSCWLPDDKGVFLYDRFDVWLIDPTGVNNPINFTNGYGRKNKISIRCVEIRNLNDQNELVKADEGRIVLVGFSSKNKTFGFYGKRLNETGDPVVLTKQRPEIFYSSEMVNITNSSLQYLDKAKDTNVYALKHCSTTNPPNFVITKDFVNFTKLSNINPQKKFNWLTSELVRWKTFKGKDGEGILFKPENFDPQKKYPIIFYFYDRLSDGLNAFIEPELSVGPMNISILVSQGYLVFCPDIYYTIGYPGESCYDYVVSAADKLSKQPWVDKSKMAIQGHSWGGYQVDYLVTRTHLFHAAVAAAGITDYMSGNMSLYGYQGGSGPWMKQFESAQLRMGSSFWENKQGYLKNSPIFNADKVETPLLIMHNEVDCSVPWSQGVEYYLSLRRLGSPVWMLQYNGEGHTIGGHNALDYSIRMKQFFDHYLKDAPAPIWMTQGISARQKLIKTGYEFDPSGSCNKDCKVCKYWNEKFKKDSAACWKEIEEKTKSEHWIE